MPLDETPSEGPLEAVSTGLSDPAAEAPQAQPSQPRPQGQSSGKRSKAAASLPSLPRKVTLHTWVAQTVFKRAFTSFQMDAFTLTTRLRDLGLDRAADSAEAYLNAEIAAVSGALRNEIAQADHLMNEMGLADLPEYSDVRHEKAKVTSGYGARLLDIIGLLDQLCMRLDALAITGYIEQSRRDKRMRQWKGNLLKLSGRARNFAGNVRAVLKTREGAERPAGFDAIEAIRQLTPTHAPARPDDAGDER
jgi:hypothetical protein